MSERVEAAAVALIANGKSMDAASRVLADWKACDSAMYRIVTKRAEAILAAADRVSLAGTEVGWMMQARAGYFRNGYLIVPPVSREEYPLGGATRHRPTLFDEFAKECDQAAAALAGLAGENAKLKAALKEIGREQSYATSRAAADRFKSIARAALQEPPDAP